MGKPIAHLSDLTPDPHNARAHNPRNIGMIEAALNEVGAARSIVIDEDGIVLAGNATIAAAAQAGIEKVQVVEADGETIIAVRRRDLTPEQKTKLALFDNRAAELAEWDTSVLAELAADMDLSGLFREEELAELLAGVGEPELGGGGDDFDAAPEDGPTKTALGDLWVIGDKHRLVVGDCTDPAVVERLMGGERAALCFTSPPYSDQREYSKDSDLAPEHLAQFITVSANAVDLYAVNLGMSRKDNEIQTYWDIYIEAARDAGLKLLSWNVWDQGAVGAVGKITAMFPIEHEFIFIFGERRIGLNLTVPNKTAGTINNHVADRQSNGHVQPKRDILIRDRRALGTVIRCAPQKARNVDTSHSAMFPVELPTMYIEACSGRGDIVYDPFLGSGTSVIAAHRAGRRCFGAEINPRYADICLRRAESEGLSCSLAAGPPCTRQE